MKRIITFIIYVFFPLSIFSQEFTVKIYVEDNLGRKDTATIGFNELSTIDIDPSFGEENINGVPFDSLDIRIIKRDSLHFNCLRETHLQSPPAPNIYFSNNVDTKIDIRPFSPNLNSPDNNFEIFINAIEYPIMVMAVREELFNNGVVGGIHLLNSDCNSSNFFEVGYQHSASEPQMFSIDNDSFNTLVAEFEILINTKKIDQLKPLWSIFPNPAKDKLEIESEYYFDGKLELINPAGLILKSFTAIPNSKKLVLNIEELNKGLYFIRYINSHKKEISVRKFIKK